MRAKADKMYGLLAIALSLCPLQIDASVSATLQDMHGDKIVEMMRGVPASFPVFEARPRPAFPPPPPPPPRFAHALRCRCARRQRSRAPSQGLLCTGTSRNGIRPPLNHVDSVYVGITE